MAKGRTGLWFRVAGSPRRLPVRISRGLSGEMLQLVMPCGRCGREFVLPPVVTFSHDVTGAVSTERSFNCPHCGQWWVRLIVGEAVPGSVMFCPSCGLRIETPPRYGWVQCGVCAFEGRVSDTLPEPPEEEWRGGRADPMV